MLPISPPAFVAFPIKPGKDSITVFFILKVETFIRFAIAKGEFAIAMHQVLVELPFIRAFVIPFLPSNPVYHVIGPLSNEYGLVRPNLLAESAFLAKIKLALIYAAVLPGLDAPPMLQVVLPLPVVGAASVHTPVHALATGFVPIPVAFVGVANGVDEEAVAMSAIVKPVAFVGGAVGPGDLAMALSEAALPVTCVEGATALVGKGAAGQGLERRVGLHRAQRFPKLLLSEVFPLDLQSQQHNLQLQFNV